MKKLFKLTALLLCLAMLTSTFAGCGLFGGDEDEPVDEFNPPHFENYYLNKHEPVMKSGAVDIYKYENAQSYSLSMGGNRYNGGVVLRYDYFEYEHFDIEFPLEGQYDHFSFVLGGESCVIMKTSDGEDSYAYTEFAMDGSYPTLVGQAKEMKLGLQVLVDGKTVDEFVVSCYDVVKRFTYDVSGAQNIEIKAVTGDDGFSVTMAEITVWNGEPHETGYVPAPAGSAPVQLVKDLKPYLIPSTSGAVCYPNDGQTSEGRNYINMSGTRYENVIATFVSMGMVTDDEEDIYFDLEGKYNYLTFTAGAADRTTSYDEGTAWLTVYADGKIIYEETYSTHELPRKVTLDVTGCRQLKFGWLTDEGNENFGTATGSYYGIADAYVATTKEALDGVSDSSQNLLDRPVKMVSELGTFGVVSNVEQAVFDGSTKFKTFSMGGIKYNEGIILYAPNSVIATKPANASFNLGGKYNTISFIVGHISNSNVYENDQIEIYADGTLIKTIDIKFHMTPQEYVVDVTGCKHLEFVSGKLTNALMERPAYGIAELVAYPDGYVETDLFPERKPEDFGKSCDLIDTFGFYDVYNSILSKKLGAVNVEDGYYDGTTNKNTFQIGDKTYNKGILLRTSVYLELNMAGVGAASLLGGGGVWGPGLLIIALAGAGEAHESSFALANIKDSGYTSVTFTVAMQQDNSSIIVQDESTLMIVADDECVKEITVSKNMEPTTYTVELGEDCERLMFWLNCSEEDDGSHTYAIYDIKLNK